MKQRILTLVLLVAMLFTQVPLLPISAEDTELEKVTVILDYIFNTNHAGLLVALENGYYEEEGLDVEIIEPAEGVTTTLISVGRGDYGVTYQEDLVYARTAEDPLPIVAIAAVIQNNTSGFVSAKSKNITRPKDFEGKVYSGWGSPAEEAILHAVMLADGADPELLEYSMSSFSDYRVLEGDIDLLWFFKAWDLVMAQREGLELNYIPNYEYDERLNFYTPILFTTEDKIAEDPEQVEAFMKATSRGYEDAIADPKAAAAIVHKYAPLYELDFLEESMEILADEYAKGADRWGEMKKEVWDNYSDFMFEYDLIPEMPESEECYTNEFLPEAKADDGAEDANDGNEASEADETTEIEAETSEKIDDNEDTQEADED